MRKTKKKSVPNNETMFYFEDIDRWKERVLKKRC